MIRILPASVIGDLGIRVERLQAIVHKSLVIQGHVIGRTQELGHILSDPDSVIHLDGYLLGPGAPPFGRDHDRSVPGFRTVQNRGRNTVEKRHALDLRRHERGSRQRLVSRHSVHDNQRIAQAPNIIRTDQAGDAGLDQLIQIPAVHDAVIFGRTDDPDRIHQLALFHGLESDGHIGLFLVIQRSLRHFDLCRQLTGRIRHGSQPFRLNHQHRIGRYLEREPAESVRFGFGKSPLSMDNRPLDRDAVLVEDDGFDIQTPLFYLILRPSTERAQQQKDKTQFYYVIHRR